MPFLGASSPHRSPLFQSHPDPFAPTSLGDVEPEMAPSAQHEPEFNETLPLHALEDKDLQHLCKRFDVRVPEPPTREAMVRELRARVDNQAVYSFNLSNEAIRTLLRHMGETVRGTRAELMSRLLYPLHSQMARAALRYEEHSSEQLEALCEERGLGAKGSRRELVERLSRSDVTDATVRRAYANHRMPPYGILQNQPVANARELCRTLGLHTSGVKSVVIQRLVEYELCEHLRHERTEVGGYAVQSLGFGMQRMTMELLRWYRMHQTRLERIHAMSDPAEIVATLTAGRTKPRHGAPHLVQLFRPENLIGLAHHPGKQQLHSELHSAITDWRDKFAVELHERDPMPRPVPDSFTTEGHLRVGPVPYEFQVQDRNLRRRGKIPSLRLHAYFLGTPNESPVVDILMHWFLSTGDEGELSMSLETSERVCKSLLDRVNDMDKALGRARLHISGQHAEDVLQQVILLFNFVSVNESAAEDSFGASESTMRTASTLMLTLRRVNVFLREVAEDDELLESRYTPAQRQMLARASASVRQLYSTLKAPFETAKLRFLKGNAAT